MEHEIRYSDLTPWQRDLVKALLSGVPPELVEGRGRRAGYTIALRFVEDALKWRGPGRCTLWDGVEVDPDDFPSWLVPCE